MPNNTISADGQAVPGGEHFNLDATSILEVLGDFARLENRIRFFAVGAEAVAGSVGGLRIVGTARERQAM